MKQSTFVGFIDFAKAFDTVWRDALLLKLSNMGVKGKMLRMIRALYGDTKASVRVNGELTEVFSTLQGVRQGGVLSPTLFLVFINDLIEALRAKQIGVMVPGFEGDNVFSRGPNNLPGLLWADDVVILAETEEQLREAFSVVDDWCLNWGMSVNSKKSNVMLVGPVPSSALISIERIAANKPFTLGGGNVSPTKVYKYLGMQLSYDLSWGGAVAARCAAVRHSIFAQGPILRNNAITVDLRRHFFDSVVTPVALWGCELWAHDEAKCNKVERALGPGLRMLLNMPARTNVTALLWELGTPPLRVKVAARRLRLL